MYEIYWLTLHCFTCDRCDMSSISLGPIPGAFRSRLTIFSFPRAAAICSGVVLLSRVTELTSTTLDSIKI